MKFYVISVSSDGYTRTFSAGNDWVFIKLKITQFGKEWDFYKCSY